jgi:hypothetical protein
MTRETQYQLYRALNAHTSALEITRSFTSGRDLEVLDRRIEAAHGLLEWVEQALERPVSRQFQRRPPSSVVPVSPLPKRKASLGRRQIP